MATEGLQGLSLNRSIEGSHLCQHLQGEGLVGVDPRVVDDGHDRLERLHAGPAVSSRMVLAALQQRMQGTLTRRIRNTLRAAATEACIFLTLPGSPAEMNMQAYCMQHLSVSQGQREQLFTGRVQACLDQGCQLVLAIALGLQGGSRWLRRAVVRGCAAETSASVGVWVSAYAQLWEGLALHQSPAEPYQEAVCSLQPRQKQASMV